jgi:hypothetical protein
MSVKSEMKAHTHFLTFTLSPPSLLFHILIVKDDYLDLLSMCEGRMIERFNFFVSFNGWKNSKDAELISLQFA